MPEPVIVVRPGAETPPLPLVFDSPHSGHAFPEDMKPAIPVRVLRRNEDAFVDQLYGHVTVLGAVLVKATFPRTYIDPNRPLDAIEPGMLTEPWPGPLDASEKTGRGAGLVWSRIMGTLPIYDRKLSVAEVTHRIDAYWRPYHDALRGELDRLHGVFGAVWHINCHSMPSRGNATTADGDVERPDFILGSRDGTTCEPGLTETVRDFLAGRGADVAVDVLMKGAEIVRLYGDPAANRHSLQIEIARRLFMDEEGIQKNGGYPETAALIADMNAVIADYVRSRVGI